MSTNTKFLGANLIAGTSEIAASSGTSSTANLIDKNLATKWTSVSQGTDGLSPTITWTPASGTETINRIMIREHNFKTFNVYYNGQQTNKFSPDVAVVNGTNLNYYFEFANQVINSVTIIVSHTTPTPNQEKSCAEIYFGSQLFEPANNPDEYHPVLYRKGDDFEVGDGGAKSVQWGLKFRASLKWTMVAPVERNNFTTLFNRRAPMWFVPLPALGTAGVWNGRAWEVMWVGDCDTEELTAGIDESVGYNVNMKLQET